MKDSIFPRFSDEEYQRRFVKIQQMMEEEGVSALLIVGTSALNRIGQADLFYVSNFLGNWTNVALFPLEGEPALFVQSYNHVPDAQRASILEDTRYGGASTAQTIVEELKARKLTRGDIGIVGPLPYDGYLTITGGLPDLNLRNLTPAYRNVRAVMSDEEITRLRKAAALSDASIYALKEQAKPDITEYDLGIIVENAYTKDGGQHYIRYISSTSMHASERCVPAQNQGDRLIQKGDVILTEISAAYWGYTGQILRPISVAEDPTPDYQELYDVAEDAYYRVVEAIKPGVSAQEVFELSKFIDETGYTIVDGLVHGFGSGIHPPGFHTPEVQKRPIAPFTFQPNMGVVVQPNIVTRDFQKGVQLGNLCLVTESGLEPLQKYPVEFVRAG
jgi:Xaa-Pro aminopeptidase